ncbi:lectin like domain-containing protein [Adlercreutzia sp. ZJ141]|uniref:lectin like domain-containing protein n=1 Tax=Adlercreutzia sp. ZJ141 TaxID=2709406 RepID=UPI0013EAC87D|nr:lectin like domain-containing protein [Adlercreutzia sp. ZJ141]
MKMQPPSFVNRLTRAALAVLLAVVFVPVMPGVACAEPSVAAAADNSAAIDRFLRVFNEVDAEMRQKYNATGNVDDLLTNRANNGFGATNGIASLSEEAIPKAYDLRDPKIDKVTPVKFQNPWATCWSFGAMAASETSILSELGWSASQGLDLSELHLAWLAYTPLSQEAITASGSANYQSQLGEGYYTVDAAGNHKTDPDIVLEQGGSPPTITSVLSSGIGPVPEKEVPYRSTEGETVNDSEGNPVYYSPKGDWSVDEKRRFMSSIQLEDANLLPSPADIDSQGGYHFNQPGVDAIKSELLKGRAVSINFCADQYMPGMSPEDNKYLNTKTWAHYTYEVVPITHAVTIVGWNDEYSKDNFLTSEQVSGATPPPCDGAWIVKNSWGSESGTFPNKFNWGDDGYFYLSYFDQSINNVESFDYDTTTMGDKGKYRIIDQYDFMPSTSPMTLPNPLPASMANVFTADERQEVTSVSFETSCPNTTVTYQMYLLDKDATGPKDGTLVATDTLTYEYGGYHLVHLPQSVIVEKGHRYSVVVTEKAAVPGLDGEFYLVQLDKGINRLGWERLIEDDPDLKGVLTKYSCGIVNPGESYSITTEDSGELTEDLFDIVAELKASNPGDEDDIPSDSFDYDNFPIKAYANPVPEPAYVEKPVSAPFVDGNKTVIVSAIGEFPEWADVELVLTAVDEKTTSALAELGGEKQRILAVDVALRDKNTKYPIDFKGSLALTFDVGTSYEGWMVNVAHLPAGAQEEVFKGLVVTNGKVAVNVTTLSPFGVFGEAPSPAPAPVPAGGATKKPLVATGDSLGVSAATATGIAAIAACAGAVAVVRMRRRSR